VLHGDISIPGFPRTVTIKIPADKLWVDTGVDVKKGQTVIITASGWGSTCTGHRECNIPSPEGNGALCVPNCLMNYVDYGALLGQISSSGPFYVGKSFTTTADESGTLYLAINDIISQYEDNAGSFVATITVR